MPDPGESPAHADERIRKAEVLGTDRRMLEPFPIGSEKALQSLDLPRFLTANRCPRAGPVPTKAPTGKGPAGASRFSLAGDTDCLRPCAQKFPNHGRTADGAADPNEKAPPRTRGGASSFSPVPRKASRGNLPHQTATWLTARKRSAGTAWARGRIQAIRSRGSPRRAPHHQAKSTGLRPGPPRLLIRVHPAGRDLDRNAGGSPARSDIPTSKSSRSTTSVRSSPRTWGRVRDVLAARRDRTGSVP